MSLPETRVSGLWDIGDAWGLFRAGRGKGTNLIFPDGGSSCWNEDGHSFSTLLSRVWTSVGFLRTLFLRWDFPAVIWWLGWLDFFCFSESGRRESSFLPILHFQCLKDLQWFQHVHISETSRLLNTILAEVRWILFLFVLGMVHFSSALTLFLDCLHSWSLELFSLVLLVFSCKFSCLWALSQEPIAVHSTAHSTVHSTVHSDFSISRTGSWSEQFCQEAQRPTALSFHPELILGAFITLDFSYTPSLPQWLLWVLPHSAIYPRCTLNLVCNWDSVLNGFNFWSSSCYFPCSGIIHLYHHAWLLWF